MGRSFLMEVCYLVPEWPFRVRPGFIWYVAKQFEWEAQGLCGTLENKII